ncbi:MAG: BMP family ABC transporter substrate-binding protein [Anaerolineae bacterium]|nr:BMP family ABC transporter substrate-binding protein [Anaerolineae bacterium]
MNRRVLLSLAVLLAVLVSTGGGLLAQEDEFVFGLVLVGPHNDHGWSEAHYTAGQYVEENVPNTRMVYFESLNAADAPETTMEQVVQEMVSDGATLIFTTSDAFEEDTLGVAEAFPDITFVNVSGDDVLTGEAPANEGNLMGNMVWGKQIAGCAAALATETGSIGYLGPLINAETRRLASSVYLGARYCYENYRGMDPDELTFTVTWIGFWFNIPGVTLDPTEETQRFFDQGADVVVSGIDTTEALVVAGQRAAEGDAVWAVPYDYEGACAEAPEVCLGVPYFNWGPDYVDIVQAAIDGTWEQSWTWNSPYWEDLTDNDMTAVGWVMGDALTEEQSAMLDEFIAFLAEQDSGNLDAETVFDDMRGLGLWDASLTYQDGTSVAGEDEVLTPAEVWYLEQLLEGMVGDSAAQ